MDSENSKQNRMATEPIPKLMFKIGVPIVLSMMLQAVYNIVDSAYLSNMDEAGEEALTALGLAFPIQLLIIAMSIGTGVGVNALMSRSLGQGKKDKASRAAGNGIFMAIVITICFMLFAFFGVRAYVNSQNSSGAISEIVIEMTVDYLQICCGWSFGIVFFSVFEKMLQSTGRSVFSTVAQVTGAVINIALDPILIYGWLGAPEMGVKGAAYATIIGQIASFIVALGFYLKYNVDIDKSPKYILPKASILKEIYVIGLPAIISQALLTVMTYGLNIILGQIPDVGENAVTVYGLYCKIQQLIIFAAVGMRDTITPVVSFNYGARSKKRTKDAIKYGLIYTAVLMFIGLLIIEIFAEQLTTFFSLSDQTFDMCVDCMRIISIGFPIAGLCVAFQGIFQAVECGIESLIISLGRQVVFVLPVAWAISQFITGIENVYLVWYTFFIAEVLTMICTLIMYRRKKVRKKVNIED